jgi:hypothetical protein
MKMHVLRPVDPGAARVNQKEGDRKMKKLLLGMSSALLVSLYSLAAFAQDAAAAGGPAASNANDKSMAAMLAAAIAGPHRRGRTRRHRAQPGRIGQDHDPDDSRPRARRVARALRVRHRLPRVRQGLIRRPPVPSQGSTQGLRW